MAARSQPGDASLAASEAGNSPSMIAESLLGNRRNIKRTCRQTSYRPARRFKTAFNFFQLATLQKVWNADTPREQRASENEQISRLVGIKWREMSQQEKKPYLDMAAEDKARYRREVAAIRNAATSRISRSASLAAAASIASDLSSSRAHGSRRTRATRGATISATPPEKRSKPKKRPRPDVGLDSHESSTSSRKGESKSSRKAISSRRTVGKTERKRKPKNTASTSITSSAKSVSRRKVKEDTKKRSKSTNGKKRHEKRRKTGQSNIIKPMENMFMFSAAFGDSTPARRSEETVHSPPEQKLEDREGSSSGNTSSDELLISGGKSGWEGTKDSSNQLDAFLNSLGDENSPPLVNERHLDLLQSTRNFPTHSGSPILNPSPPRTCSSTSIAQALSPLLQDILPQQRTSPIVTEQLQPPQRPHLQLSSAATETTLPTLQPFRTQAMPSFTMPSHAMQHQLRNLGTGIVPTTLGGMQQPESASGKRQRGDTGEDGEVVNLCDWVMSENFPGTFRKNLPSA